MNSRTKIQMLEASHFHAETSAEQLKNLVRQISTVVQTLDNAARACVDDQPAGALNEDEVIRLSEINRHLSKLEDYLRKLGSTYLPSLEARKSDPEDPLEYFDIRVGSSYQLRKEDPEWRPSGVNALTWRDESLYFDFDHFSDGKDYRDLDSEVDTPETGHQCWSFHKLLNSDINRFTHFSLSPRDCLRLGSVWVTVEIQQRYRLDLDTGEWDKEVRSPARQSQSHIRKN